MADRGYRNWPLIVTEYGILMPSSYDAGNGRTYDHAFMREFMLGTFDFFLNATDNETGDPQDGNRLVQAWSWYSLNDYPYNFDTRIGFNGNLLDHDTGVMTPLGQDFAGYAAKVYTPYTEVTLQDAQVTPAHVVSVTSTTTITIHVVVNNRGNVPAQQVSVRLYDGDPAQGGRLLHQSQAVDNLGPHCAGPANFDFVWQPQSLASGFHQIIAEIVYQDNGQQVDQTNVVPLGTLEVGPDSHFQRIYLPLASK